LVTLQARVGIVEGLGLEEVMESPIRRTSGEASPPVLMTHEGLALVGEPSAEQVAMFVADEVVWEAQREEWVKDGSGGMIPTTMSIVAKVDRPPVTNLSSSAQDTRSNHSNS
jgi:hypothetical protein